ncbi:MAG TPA: methylated-DNA--[protein]-cysteine S-methyltransferase [Pseudobdellovibrionaceae bacterium]|nr:methylated-DNA--[protein]-cysteine S-methyltransferase [Pseudobdellovibrionaceae bacterium]
MKNAPAKIIRKIQTPIGPLYLAASAKGLTDLSFTNLKAPKSQSSADDHDHAANAHLDLAERELADYFDGQLSKFTVRLDLQGGTPFQREVWQALQRIPYAQTWSYKDLAKRVSRPKATRAVGSANGRNPIAIIIPCHRVIAADGGIGGYGGGLMRKRRLLAIEQSPEKLEFNIADAL